MRTPFGKTCLFFLASILILETAGFLTHELSLAAGLVVLAAFTISYFPVKVARASTNAWLTAGGIL